MTQTPQYRKLMKLCDEIPLTRDERLELATIMLRRDVDSFKTLDDDQVARMLDVVEGYEKICALIKLRF
jgi:hypothetical protein